MTQLLQQNILSLFGLSGATTGTKNELTGRLIELVEKRVILTIKLYKLLLCDMNNELVNQQYNLNKKLRSSCA
ncbi:MAG: hypothetical protein NT003_03165 [Candidatus Magasanikbacteria bacterium]|nr:hypothetical protein [Candidatus Magasanikbacteria bacterium]